MVHYKNMLKINIIMINKYNKYQHNKLLRNHNKCNKYNYNLKILKKLMNYLNLLEYLELMKIHYLLPKILVKFYKYLT